MKKRILEIILKRWWAIILIFIALPILINLLCYFAAPWEWLDKLCKPFTTPSGWTTFWGTYISGIFSLGMILVACLTLDETIDANNELRARYKEEIKPKIALSIVRLDDNDYEIEIVNYGITVASNLELSILVPQQVREKCPEFLVDDEMGFPKNGLEILYPNIKVRRPLFKVEDNKMCLYGCVQCPLNEEMLNEIIKYHAICHLDVEYTHDDAPKKKITLTFPFTFWG